MIGAHGVLELRQYTCYGGRRDELMTLFRGQFIVPQNQLGAWVLATWRDLDDPDRFVWLRAFADMPARQSALEQFYGGPVWVKYRNDANATIADSDNVLLLRPVQALQSGAAGRPALMRASLHYLRSASPADFADFFRTRLEPLVRECGGRVSGSYLTEPAANNFRLPVREGESVFVWFGEFADAAAERAFSERLATRGGWRDGAQEALLQAFMRKAEVLRLAG